MKKVLKNIDTKITFFLNFSYNKVKEVKMFQYPCDYIAITQNYQNGIHYGVDLGHSSSYGGPNHDIKAAFSGTIVKMRMNYKTNDKTGNSYGNYIEIDHGNQIHSLYAHLVYNSSTLKVGDKVTMGQLIAKMGQTGRATGIHVHFEIRKNGTRVNPLSYLYVYPNQTVQQETKEKYTLQYKKEGQVMTYTVQSGDVLWKIAEKFGTTVKELVALNNLENPDLLRPGQVLNIPQKQEETEDIDALKKEIEDLKNRLEQISKLASM